MPHISCRSLGQVLGENLSRMLIESISTHLRLVSNRGKAKDVSEGNVFFLDEPDFREILNRERKRSKRSKKPLILMCLDVSGMMIPNGTFEHRSLLKAFATCIRETDVQGWYNQESIMGILFTEIESASPSVRENLFRRVMAHLVRQADPCMLYKVKVTFHIYPGGKVHDNTVDHYNMRYYRYHACQTDKYNLSEKINCKLDVANNCKTITALLIESLK
jgi:hypothetical protein